jgi:hypothetical protein
MIALMARPLNKKTVELEGAQRPSRIRREPVPQANPNSLIGRINWDSREWEIRLAIAGILFFALGTSALVIDLGHLISQ